MESLHGLKVVLSLPPQLKNNGAFVNNTPVDTFGAAEALFLIQLGGTDVIVGSTDTSHALKVEECDESGGSYSDVSGAALSAVLGTGDDNKLYGIRVNLKKTHKRYMKINAPTAGNSTGANLSIICILGQQADSTLDAAGMGLTELVEA